MSLRHVSFAFLFCLASTAMGQVRGRTEAGMPSGQSGFVTEVPSGDLLIVALPGGSTRVRLLGAEAPSLGETPAQREYFAESARDHTRRLALRKRVSLKSDPTSPDKNEAGELLRHVYLPGGRLLDREVLRTGHGFAAEGRTFALQPELASVEEAARENAEGLWAGQGLREAEWFLREGRAAFHVHRMTDGSWGVQLGSYLKPHVPSEELGPTLAQLRSWSETLADTELSARLRSEGFAVIDPGKAEWRSLTCPEE